MKIRFISILLALIIAIVSLTSCTVKQEIAFGDIDGDNIVSIGDVKTIMSIGTMRYNGEYNFNSADVNGDGKITAYDAYLATKVMSKLVTLIEPEPEPETTIAPAIDNIQAYDKDSGDAVPVVGQTGNFSVISNQKMYIYPDMSEVMKIRNTFVIVTFGWGHGVGMSQHGAVGLARAGYSYIQILKHYYNGVVLMKERPPETVRCGSKYVKTEEMLARIVQQEISGITRQNDAYDINALKAQAVAAYTNMKYSDYSVSGCSYVSNYDRCRDDVKAVAKEMAGQFMMYNNNVIYAYYAACSGGVAAKYEQIWGPTNKDMSYLTNCASYYDVYTSDYVKAEVFTPEEMKAYIKSYDSSINLSNNPADWIKILQHDDAVNEQIGYVSRMQIGDRTLDYGAGMRFRDYVLDYAIKSPCFAIVYNGQYL